MYPAVRPPDNRFWCRSENRVALKAQERRGSSPLQNPAVSAPAAPFLGRSVGAVGALRGTKLVGPPRPLLRDLLLPEFVQGFAVNAQRRSRPGLQPLQPDLHPALVAEPIVIRLDARDGLVDLADELALAVAVAQFQRHVRLLGGAVVGVGEHRGFVLHGV